MALALILLAALVMPSAAGANTQQRHVTGTLGANGWYTSNVGVYWTFDPPPTMTQGCDARTITTEGTTNLDCKVWWGQSTAEDIFSISIDKTPPAAHGVPSRQPDANGWYNKPLTITFAGTDATSGVAGCSSSPYSGPDNGNASVSGTCTDRAGNVGPAAFGFSYDSTPPALGKVKAKHGNRSVLLSWSASADTRLIQITRSQGTKGTGSVVFRGQGASFRDKGLRPGTKYQYTVSAIDEAANASSTTVPVTGTGALTNPFPGERVTSPPRLVWLRVRKATYYNVQLIHNGRVLSAWPRRASLKLRPSWVYQGRRYRLQPGVYRWYVWPGFGKLSKAHYGRRLGGSAFVYAA